MSNFIVYDANRKILRTGGCPLGMVNMQAQAGAFAIEGVADDKTQKMEFDGFDSDGRPINPRLVDKTPAEILADNPPPPVIPDDDKPATITRGQLRQFQDRLTELEQQKT